MASSLLRSTRIVSWRSAQLSRFPFLRRTIAASPSQKMKESSGDNNDYEKHKQDSLSKQKSGRGHWKPELASDGEEAVKADKGPREDLSKLQERTKKFAEDKVKHSGTSATDPM